MATLKYSTMSSAQLNNISILKYKTLLAGNKVFNQLPPLKQKQFINDLAHIDQCLTKLNAATTKGVNVNVRLINSVDFPGFVASLIDGVFQAMVDATIEQMRAYSELVKEVTKSVDEFMQDNVTSNNQRDYLEQKYQTIKAIKSYVLHAENCRCIKCKTKS